jgi:hypothetical protein
VVAAHGVNGDQRAGIRGRRIAAALLVSALLVRPVLIAPGRLGSGMPISGGLPELGCLRLAGRRPAASRRSMAAIWLLRASHAAKLLTAPARAGLARGR